MDQELQIKGSIVDSWLERGRGSGGWGDGQIILQVAVRGLRELLVIEAPMSLIPDEGWLEDLRGNYCHGSPVAAAGWLTDSGNVSASRLRLER